MTLKRSIAEPIRQGLSNEERWRDRDSRLITCWERGRKKAEEEPELAARAKDGELVQLPWKGGLTKPIKTKQKIGTHFYLAMWQGLRGEDLIIDHDTEPVIICSRFVTAVSFTGIFEKYANTEDDK